MRHADLLLLSDDVGEACERACFSGDFMPLGRPTVRTGLGQRRPHRDAGTVASVVFRAATAVGDFQRRRICSAVTDCA